MQETELEESVVMDESEIDRTLVRMAHQILEQNKGCQNLALVGIVTRGDVLAHRLAKLIEGIEGTQLPVGSLDISFYRDDSLLLLFRARTSSFPLMAKPSCWWMMSCTPVEPFGLLSML